ncbi:hypothetical protein AB4Z01_02785 [Inquilinus sp. YAF38]|uniref:hypothetical protein n=1 Tax=Inquilinus sp. YAF38 TaxID=3233084 RepID=UPI003F93C51A
MTLHTRLVRVAFLAAALTATSPIIVAPAHAQSSWGEDQRGRWVPPDDRWRNDDDRYYDRRDDNRRYERHSDRYRRYDGDRRYDRHSDRDRRYDDDDRDRYSRRDRDRDRDRNDPVDFLQQLLR